ncbi:MAG: GDP-mannose 4,6-dehydratase [Candidatus Thorarchaeota archaeon]|jgi:GDP-mannose 4,6-dehydratase
MKYLITGISGHVAPHLARLLLWQGEEVHVLIRETSGRKYDLLDIMSPSELDAITFHYGDFVDIQTLIPIFQENKFDGVFHLGAMSHPPTSFKYPLYTMKTNIQGTANIAECIRLYNPECILCNVSTSEVYGDECKNIGVLKEDMNLYPSNPYGWSKMCAERFIRERCKNGFLKGFSTRAFSHLAPRRGKNFSISWDAYHLALMKLGLKKNKLLPVGNLQTRRVVIDARDVVTAYYLLMKAFKHLPEEINGESFNVCGDIDSVQKMEFFTDKLIEISGLKDVKKVIDKRVYRPIDIQIQIGDISKLKSVINWNSVIPIEQTLTDVYNYWVKKLQK